MKSSILSAQIVEPYAEALMSLGQSNNLTEQFGEDVRSLLGLLKESKELKTFLENPIIEAQDKRAIVQQIVGEEGNPYFLNFLKLLVDRRRIIFIEAIGERYLELLRKLNNTVLAEVISAVELNDTQKQQVIEKIKNLTEAQGVELSTKIDPDIIGGVVIKVGSQVFDASLRGQLRRISLSLSSAA